MAEGFRVTYATMSADNEELHKGYDEGIVKAKAWLGQQHPLYVNGEPRTGSGYHAEHSPVDNALVIGEFAQGTRQDAKDAIAAAKDFFPIWSDTPWQDRVKILNKAADLMSQNRNELSALMALEVGKNRLEALGDVEESADLIRWNCHAFEEHEGFRVPMTAMGAAGDYYDVMRPYGVWAIISPFNFPMALSAGPSSAALVTGNTVVFKPSTAGAAIGLRLFELYRDAGLPAGAFHYVSGPGSEVGDELVNNPDVGGLTFTGSYDVGMSIFKNFSKAYPKPVICEMGGKNPTIVTKHADLDKATDGVMRSAFGLQGQKCSANSRVYVEREKYEDFVALLKAKTDKLVVGNPLDKDVYMGPVINDAALKTYEEASAEARSSGEIISGGERVTDGDLARGAYVRPTIAAVPLTSWLWSRELFVPFVAVAPVDSMDQAMELANDTEYGLTAGFYSEDDIEVDRFLSQIQAGVVYVNRAAGSTTGAWPGAQPFGGWKGSGTTGKASGGPYYVLSYMREQSRTVIA